MKSNRSQTNILLVIIAFCAHVQYQMQAMELGSPKTTYSIFDTTDSCPTDSLWVRACDVYQPLSLAAQLLAKICTKKIVTGQGELPMELQKQLSILNRCLLRYEKDQFIAHEQYSGLLHDTKHIESFLACFSHAERTTVIAQLFYFAIVNGVIATAQLLSNQGAVITLDCLNSAVSTGNLAIVKWLYKKGGKRLLRNASDASETPLHKAVREDKLEILDFFLHKQVDVALKDSFGETALDEAIFWKRTRPIYYLLEYGADLNGESEFNNHEIKDIVSYYKKLSHKDQKIVCALSRVLASSCLKSLKKLCQQYDTLETELFFGKLVLHKAVEWSSIEIIEFILTKITNVNIQHRYTRETALHVSARRGHGEIIKLLIDHGADCTIKDKSHRLPFDLAALDKTGARDLLRTQECICFFCARAIDKRCFLTCGHAQFHKSCAKKSFKANGFTCPICREECGIRLI